MKKNLLILVFYSGCSLFVKAQWAQQTTGTGANLPGIDCTDKDTCIAVAVSPSGTRKTVDGGSNWTSVNMSTFTNLASVKMFNSNKIWVGKVNGTFHYSSNGGTNWSQVAPATTSHVIYDVFFHDANNHIAVGGSSSNHSTGGNVSITTSNGGTNWTAVNNSGVPTMFGIHCFNSSTCVASAGAETIFKTTDGGANWVVKHSGTTKSLFDIHFPSSSVGYAVGGEVSAASSVILKTTDGGETWNPLSLVVPNTINGVHFTSIDTGYAVGKGGFIMKTMDGGLTWGSQASPITTDLEKIFFPTSNIGYISGAGGVILKTTNAGGIVTGVNEYNSESLFSILGNPSHHEVKIETAFAMQCAELFIFNSLGQPVESRKNISGNSVSVKTSELAGGVYFFRLNDGEKMIAGKFIAEK